jgi:two-component system response regulator AtoC
VTPQIAVLDDEARMTEVLAMLLRREGHEVRCFTDPQACLAAIAEHGFDLLFTDLKMPGMDGLAVLTEARRLAPDMPVVLMTAHASVATALAAVRAGAFDYVEKPFDNDACRALAQRALEVTRLQRDNRYMRARLRQLGADDEVVTASPAMREVFALAARAARSRATALVCGESGTGKELVARAIHRHSDRVQGPFVAVNCKAFAGGVLESELFGHEKGAYTGASQTRAGVFERADGGTLLLDEIGEIDLEFQAKLLRVLQTREVLPVGGSRARTVDVRVVAATNRDLRAEVTAGRFREDLYFRLAVIPIRLPPLRERPEDILPLARHFLARWSAELGRSLGGGGVAAAARLARQRARAGEPDRARGRAGAGRPDLPRGPAARGGDGAAACPDGRGRGGRTRGRGAGAEPAGAPRPGGGAAHPRGAGAVRGAPGRGRPQPRGRADDALSPDEKVRHRRGRPGLKRRQVVP